MLSYDPCKIDTRNEYVAWMILYLQDIDTALTGSLLKILQILHENSICY